MPIYDLFPVYNVLPKEEAERIFEEMDEYPEGELAYIVKKVCEDESAVFVISKWMKGYYAVVEVHQGTRVQGYGSPNEAVSKVVVLRKFLVYDGQPPRYEFMGHSVVECGNVRGLVYELKKFFKIKQECTDYVTIEVPGYLGFASVPLVD